MEEIIKQHTVTTDDEIRRELRRPNFCTKIIEKTIPTVLRRAMRMERSEGWEKPMELTRSMAKNAIEKPPFSGVINRRSGGIKIVTLEIFLSRFFILAVVEVFLFLVGDIMLVLTDDSCSSVFPSSSPVPASVSSSFLASQ